MDRRFSIRYRRASNSGAENTEQRALNAEHYDRDTDNNIFALGDAAQDSAFNLDEIFKSFGLNLDDALGGQNLTSDKAVDATQGSDGGDTPSTDQQSGARTTSFSKEIIAEGDQNVQVSTIHKTLPDGRIVQTKIYRGPVQKRKRIIKINRELPNGETQLLGEIQADPNEKLDIPNAISTVLAQSLSDLPGTGEGLPPPPPSPRVVPATPTIREIEEPSPQPKPKYDHVPHIPASEGIPFVDDTPIATPRSQTPTPTQPLLPDRRTPIPFMSRRQQSVPNHCGGTTPNRSPSQKRPLFSTSSLPGTPRKFHDEEAINLFPHEGSIVHEIEVEEDEESVCPSWCPRIWTRRTRKFSSKSNNTGSKGKFGMTQSEINAEENAMPGPHALVANYARMLMADRAKFLQTLFRAVKLAKLEVVKILCSIVVKSGMKLSSPEMREPDSSATVLHVALLYNHEQVVDQLLKNGDTDLIMSKYMNEEYRNQTGLHVAVANGNPVFVEKMLSYLSPTQKQELINTIADGKYFHNKHPHGQLSLTAAAWAGSSEVIKVLVKHGANMALKNNEGNTLLHSTILQSADYPERNDYKALLKGIFDAAGIWADQMIYNSPLNSQQRELEKTQMQINLFKELLAIRNNDGYTPLALACTTTSQLFRPLLNLEKIYKIPQNRLGSITWVTYDVTDITSFSYETYNKFSVLHILAHNSQRLSRHANIDTGEDSDFLDIELIKSILWCKWGVYRWIYIVWLVIHLMYMLLFTASTAETNTSPVPFGNYSQHPETSEVHYGYAFFLILPIAYIVLEILDLFGNKPYRIQFMSGQNILVCLVKCVKSEWTITGNGPYRLVNIAFSYFVMEWFFMYIFKKPDQDLALAMALLLGWVYVLFFTRGCRVTCRFSIMIQKMFFRDLIYFLTVYGIILIAFSFAMNSLFTHQHNADNTISRVFYDMMNVVTDLDKKQSIDMARHILFARLLLIFYAIVAVILLMNMLIAMMNTSYETVRVTRCNLWKQQQLSIMLMLERRLFWWKWLCRKSERDMWRREANQEIRSYLDVTVLHTTSYKVNMNV